VNTTHFIGFYCLDHPVGVITASGVEDSRNSVLVNNLDLKFSKMMLFIIHGNWM
jgi:hypothetical protein